MNVDKYLENRRKREAEAPRYRELCLRCRQPDFSCFCKHLQAFDPGIEFVILTHPLEVKRRIATGRMAHLCLEGSHLISGQNFSDNEEVNQLLSRGNRRNVILYPGKQAANLTEQPEFTRELFIGERRTTIFVIDGTWATARQTMNQSRNLQELPRICFTPEGPSRFRVRKQPEAHCYSTIEAIHHVLDLVSYQDYQLTNLRSHDTLLKVFDKLVENQLTLIKKASNPRRPNGKASWRTRARNPRQS